MFTATPNANWIQGPASSGFWTPFVEAEQRSRLTPHPSLRPSSRPASRPEPRPAPRPAPTPAKAAPSKHGNVLSGVAVVFDRWFTPAYFQGCPKGSRVRFLPTAFDADLVRIYCGKKAFNLCINHVQDEPICSTRRGLLLLKDEAAGVMRFLLEPDNDTARAAIWIAGTLGLTGASMGWGEVQGSRIDASGGTWDVTIEEAELREVSIVSRGACPGTFSMVRT